VLLWTGTPAMRSDDALVNRDGRPPLLKAAGAGLAALGAAALATVGAADGAPPGEAPGRAAPGPQAVPAVTGGGRGPAALLPARRLCLHGPRGEAVDFPAVLDCP
jgi:hypothetical protein